jgi:hypothetical protein
MKQRYLLPTKLRSIRLLIFWFILGLVVSGITAFPIESELNIAHTWIQNHQWDNAFSKWIETAYVGVNETNAKYPFIAYGSDWLAFAHLVIAIAFIGPLRDPVKNIWVIEFGIISCLAIFPLAFIAGHLRGIPLYWQFIDCCFGLVGGSLLLLCRYRIMQLKNHDQNVLTKSKAEDVPLYFKMLER